MDDILPFKPRNRRPGNALKPGPLPEFLQRMLDRGKAEMASPFRGITTGGTPLEGLYPLMKTGLPLDGAAAAANAFLASLTPAQRAEATFDLDTGYWRAWHNMHNFLIRHGALLEHCTSEQRERALAIVRESVSAAGFKLARDVMKLNEHIGELTGRPGEFGEWYYWLSIMGNAVARRALGLADRRASPHHQLLHPRRPDGADAEVPGIGAGLCDASASMPAPGVRSRRRAQGLRADERALARAAAYGPIAMQLPFDVYGTAFNDNLVLPSQGIRYGAFRRSSASGSSTSSPSMSIAFAQATPNSLR